VAGATAAAATRRKFSGRYQDGRSPIFRVVG
jgi:hypothetical protein